MGMVPGAWRDLAQGKQGGFHPPRSNCGWGLQRKPKWAAVWSVVLIIHQKAAVSGLGESSPCGSSLQDAQFHRAPVGTVSLIPVQEEDVKAKVRHFKAFFAKLRGFAFYLKVSFWISAPFQVMLKVKLSRLFWAGAHQQRSCSSRIVCSGKRQRYVILLVLKKPLRESYSSAATRARCSCSISLLLSGRFN